MKPAICAVCGKFGAFKGESIEFADYKPLPDDVMGHPDGFECFCDEHLDAARALVHLPSNEAIPLLRKQFGYPIDGPSEPQPHCPQCGKRNWSHHDIPGQNALRAKVSRVTGKIAWVGYAVFLIGLLLANLPWVQNYALICLGVLIAVIPGYFLAKRFGSAIDNKVDICQACGCVLTGSQFADALQREEEKAA